MRPTRSSHDQIPSARNGLKLEPGFHIGLKISGSIDSNEKQNPSGYHPLPRSLASSLPPSVPSSLRALSKVGLSPTASSFRSPNPSSCLITRVLAHGLLSSHQLHQSRTIVSLTCKNGNGYFFLLFWVIRSGFRFLCFSIIYSSDYSLLYVPFGCWENAGKEMKKLKFCASLKTKSFTCQS